MRDARLRRLIVACAVVAAALWLGATGDERDGPAPYAGGVPAGAQPAVVEHVVDGDTVRVSVDGAGGLGPGEHRIRLLQIDSPELDTGDGAAECGAEAARAFLRTRLPRGTHVWLEADRHDTDRFGRPLRYVWTRDGRMVNRAVVASGHARAVLFAPNDRHWQTMAAAQTAARRDRAGMWRACDVR